MRRRCANCMVIVAALCAAALLAVGCGRGGDGDSASTDIAAMNAALAMRETALEERLAALEPQSVDDVFRHFCVSIDEQVAALSLEQAIDKAETNTNDETPWEDEMRALLPASPEEGSNSVEVIATLARFRSDGSALEAQVTEAAESEKLARRNVDMAFESFDAIVDEWHYERNLGDFLDNFADEKRETEALLSGWRNMRLEKMANGDTATFPIFAEATLERYAAWENWASDAAAIQREMFTGIFPRICGAMSNVIVRIADVVREHARFEDAVARLRATPADAKLMAVARDEALAAFNGPVREALDAMSKWDENETNFPVEARKRAVALGKRAVALDADVSSFADIHGNYLSQQSQNKTKGTTTRARTLIKDAREAIKDFEDGMVSLRGEGDALTVLGFSARESASKIRSMSDSDEDALCVAIAKIENVRLKIEPQGASAHDGAVARRKALALRREAAEISLRDAENTLARAEGDFATAKTKALADEKTALWNAEKNRMRGNLVDIRTALDKAPRPGYKRPESDANALRETVGRLLGRIDSMGENELRTAVKKAQDDFNVIEAKTKWTIGARHPERPHIFASTENGKDVWECDPGYAWVEPGSYNLDCYWLPGRSHPDHPHVSAGQTEGTWVPDPGYKARWNGDLNPVWTKGMRHPTKPHIFAMEKERTWDADPGYWFDHPGENSDLVVSWRPGRSHPDHPNVSAGRTEGTWVPDPGYKARWDGDLDPVWTPGMRHPNWPHVVAKVENGKNVWGREPGYDWASSDGSDFSVRWKPGLRHPEHEGIESAQQEGKWNLLPGWTWVNPGTSNLDTRWVPGARYPGKPHIHASDNKWKWSADDGYDFDDYNSSNLSVHWESGSWHSRYSGVIASRQEGYWETAAGWNFVVSGPSVRNESSDLRAQWVPGKWHPTQRHVYASQSENRWSCEEGYTFVNPSGSYLSVRWTPGWVSPDGQKRAKQQEGRFEQKRDCSSCENGYKIHWKRCEICNGSGRFLFGDCPRCEGIGKIQNKTFCTNCNGVGWKWR